MGEQWRSWGAVSGQKTAHYTRGVTDDLSYDHGEWALGFNYGPISSWEHEYLNAVVRWMALKIGRKRSRFPKDSVEPNVFPRRHPFMVYDGHQAWPVIVTEKSSGFWCETDALGASWPDQESILAAGMYDASMDELGVFAADSKSIEHLYETDFPRWRKEHLGLMRKAFSSGVALVYPKLRGELQRLEDLWVKTLPESSTA